MSPQYFALIPASGVGSRLGAACPKQYLSIAGKPMLLHVMETFYAAKAIAHTFTVVSASDCYADDLLPLGSLLTQRITLLRCGGDTRRASVLNGLRAMRPQVQDDDWILVHDAARPGLTVNLINRLIGALEDDLVGGLLALRVVDTLKLGNQDNRALSTVPRKDLWAAQTPQMFRYGLLCRALEQVGDVTDEASAIEALGLQPSLVEGHLCNFKVTLPSDISLAELYLTYYPQNS